MAVTDLTDSLPYWARGGGPGPTGGPGAAPMGGGNSASWLEYLQQMFGSPAQADTLTQNQQLNALLAARAGGATQPNSDNAINAAASVPPAPPGAAPMRPPNTAGLPPGALSSANLGAYNNMPTPSGGGGGAALSGAAPLPASAAPSAANPLAAAGGGASAMGSTSNPRFVGLDYRPNASPQNSMRGGPQATALNLAGLFGGSPGPGNPANVPAKNAQPVAGPLAANSPLISQTTGQPMPMSSADAAAHFIQTPNGIVPAPLPPTMPGDIRRQRAIQLAAARSGFA